MNEDEIAQLAQTVADADPLLASILFVVAGARCLGTDRELANLVADWAKKQLAQHGTYADWLKNG